MGVPAVALWAAASNAQSASVCVRACDMQYACVGSALTPPGHCLDLA